MTTTALTESGKPGGRAAALILFATAIAAVALLVNHPGGEATDFASLLKSEAAAQLMNAIVHGGFILVLAIQLIGYAAFSARLSFARVATIAGFTLFAIGVAFMMGSLLVDGLMIPALSARYVAATPEKMESARVMFVFAGAALQFLMPIGLGFQGLGIMGWGASLLQGPSRSTGAIAVVLGIAVIAAVVGADITGAQHMLMMAIVGVNLWAVMAGILLFRRTV